jgi:hypothetical protein
MGNRATVCGRSPLTNANSALPFPIGARRAILSFSIPPFVFEEARMGARRIRREQRDQDQLASRHTNGFRKDKERIRRDSRMFALAKRSTFPYTPSVLSWLSVQLDKPGHKITPDDVKTLTK